MHACARLELTRMPEALTKPARCRRVRTQARDVPTHKLHAAPEHELNRMPEALIEPSKRGPDGACRHAYET
jgi:hypothetical protein